MPNRAMCAAGAIFAHEATGAFISHCGWNSCLESMVAEVPIIMFPVQVDQTTNALLLAREEKVAVDMKTVKGVVGRNELERAVWSLMSVESVEVKQRVEAVSKAVVYAIFYKDEDAWRNLDSFILYAVR